MWQNNCEESDKFETQGTTSEKCCLKVEMVNRVNILLPLVAAIRMNTQQLHLSVS